MSLHSFSGNHFWASMSAGPAADDAPSPNCELPVTPTQQPHHEHFWLQPQPREHHWQQPHHEHPWLQPQPREHHWQQPHHEHFWLQPQPREHPWQQPHREHHWQQRQRHLQNQLADCLADLRDSCDQLRLMRGSDRVSEEEREGRCADLLASIIKRHGVFHYDVTEFVTEFGVSDFTATLFENDRALKWIYKDVRPSITLMNISSNTPSGGGFDGGGSDCATKRKRSASFVEAQEAPPVHNPAAQGNGGGGGNAGGGDAVQRSLVRPRERPVQQPQQPQQPQQQQQPAHHRQRTHPQEHHRAMQAQQNRAVEADEQLAVARKHVSNTLLSLWKMLDEHNNSATNPNPIAEEEAAAVQLLQFDAVQLLERDVGACLQCVIDCSVEFGQAEWFLRAAALSEELNRAAMRTIDRVTRLLTQQDHTNNNNNNNRGSGSNNEGEGKAEERKGVVVVVDRDPAAEQQQQQQQHPQHPDVGWLEKSTIPSFVKNAAKMEIINDVRSATSSCTSSHFHCSTSVARLARPLLVAVQTETDDSSCAAHDMMDSIASRIKTSKSAAAVATFLSEKIHFGWTAAHIVVLAGARDEGGVLHLLDAMLAWGADVAKVVATVRGPNDITPTHLAVHLGCVSVVEKLVAGHPDVVNAALNDDGMTPLMLAVCCCCCSSCGVRGVNNNNNTVIRAPPTPCTTTTSTTASSAAEEIVRCLLDNRECKLDATTTKNANEWSALHFAAALNNVGALRLLLQEQKERQRLRSGGGGGGKAKMLVDHPDSRGCTALHIAIERGHTACAKLLLEAGASATMTVSRHGCFKGWSPMRLAALHPDAATINVLIEWANNKPRQLSIMLTSGGSGRSSSSKCLPIHVAAAVGNTRVVEVLAAADQSSLLKGDDAKITPIGVAAWYGFAATVEALHKAAAAADAGAAAQAARAGANNAVDLNGWFPVSNHWVRDSCRRGGDDEGNKGITTAHVAVLRGHVHLLDALLNLDDGAGKWLSVVCDSTGNTPLDYAIAKGDVRLAVTLACALMQLLPVDDPAASDHVKACRQRALAIATQSEAMSEAAVFLCVEADYAWLHW